MSIYTTIERFLAKRRYRHLSKKILHTLANFDTEEMDYSAQKELIDLEWKFGQRLFYKPEKFYPDGKPVLPWHHCLIGGELCEISVQYGRGFAMSKSGAFFRLESCDKPFEFVCDAGPGVA